MQRLAALQDVMRAEGIDLVALGPGSHLSWLTGVHPHADERPLLYCVTWQGAAFLMPALEAESARQQTDQAFHSWADADGPGAAFAALLEALGGKTAQSIALDETMRADFAALVQDALPGAQRQFSASTVGALRMRKDADEARALKRSAKLCDEVMQATWAAMRPGMSEREVADVAREAFKAQGAAPLFTIVGAGPNGAFPHHQTGARLLQEGDVVVMDMGARLEGYPSDMTRMAAIGAAPADYAAIHAIVDAAVEAALAVAKPGVRASEVDKAARDVIAAAGYGPNFVHRTGHGLGLDVHEPPYITATSDTVLQEGMVFSIEPGIYLPDQFGLRLEEIVILRADGPEILSELSRDLHIVGA